MMTSVNTTTPARLFQIYMDSFFKFPKDIRNDIIYCQRALRDHIKVHQLVLEVFEQQAVKTPAHRDRILNELESEIFEINAEQHFLFLRLRRVINEFFKMLKKNNIPPDTEITNAYISREVVPFINDSSLIIEPVTVAVRFSEEKLIQKYFEIQDEAKNRPSTNTNSNTISNSNSNNNEVECEIIDLCDNDDDLVEPNVTTTSTYTVPQKKFKKEPIDPLAQKSQESLLKPIEERMAVSSNNIPNIPNNDNKIPPETTETEIEAETEASKSVKLSRMNLRQALKRAHHSVASAKTAAKQNDSDSKVKENQSKKSPPKQQQNIEKSPAVSPTAKKNQIENKNRTTRSSVTTALSSTSAPLPEPKSPESPNSSSSSEDSNLEKEPLSPHPFWPDEVAESRVAAEEYGQELFLRIFDLYTPEVIVQLQQRRSKRKRRTVHNKCSDFHYGRIESKKEAKEQKKEIKTFLLSPQAKAKRPKRQSAEKIEESPVPSRSNSSSPNEKRNCNECLKNIGHLDQCIECKSHFHQSCHREVDDPPKNKKPNSIETKLCPACKLKSDKLLKREKLQHKNLQHAAKELEHRLTLLKERRQKLQNESKVYKMKMMNLLDIVKTIKEDKPKDEEISSE